MKKPYLHIAATVLIFMGAAHAQNIVQNGDFSSGNTGFGTAYTYIPYNYANYTLTPQVLEGDYTVGFYVPPSYTDWAPFNTVSGGNTQMLIGNGAEIGSESVWNQTVTVRPNTKYTISFYLAEISATTLPNTLANIAVSLSGNQIGSATAPSVIDTWQQFSFTWTSGLETSDALSLSDLNTDGPGNDFAIDNITMTAVPEPSALNLLALGLPLAFVFRKRLA